MEILSNTNTKECSNCGACYNVCPVNAVSLRIDDYGFEYPEIDSEKCIGCQKCVAACKNTQTMELRTPIEAYAATNRNTDVLMSSSSGGVFSALAEYVLSQSGVVCGCIYDENLLPVHVCTQKHDDVVLMRKSKYVQSNIGSVYRDILNILKSGQLVLFTGTPCQVAGLYAVVGKKYTNLITVDLICHGVPSRELFKKFLQYLEDKYKTRIVQFDFRSKKYKWQRYTAEFKDDKGRIRNIGKVNEFYPSAFTGGNILRPNCFNCRFACSERVGDITIGDFWGHEALDLKCDKTNGISVLIINTPKAQVLTEVLSKQLILEKVAYETVVAGNTCLRHPTLKGAKWEDYMQAVKNDTISDMARKYRSKNKKKILRGTIKLLVPISILQRMNKRKYKQQASGGSDY